MGLRSALDKADAFAFPSAWNEPFRMPVIEVMASGVTLVAAGGCVTAGRVARRARGG